MGVRFDIGFRGAFWDSALTSAMHGIDAGSAVDAARYRRFDMGSAYHFVTVWRVAGTIEEVKVVLRDGAALPQWWPSVYLSVHEIDKGGPDGEGAMAALHTKGWLPYTLRWTLRVTEPVTDTGFALEATGDLNGTGRWTFEQDGPEVVITYDWRVRASKPLLRRLSWLLRPVFSANHHWAMRRGEESLQLEMRRRRAAGSGAAMSIPPPPPATFRRLRRMAKPSGAGPTTARPGHRDSQGDEQ